MTSRNPKADMYSLIGIGVLFLCVAVGIGSCSVLMSLSHNWDSYTDHQIH